MYEKNRGYKSCCGSEMRVIKKQNSPVVEIIHNSTTQDFMVDPRNFDFQTTIIIQNIPKAFVLQQPDDDEPASVVDTYSWWGAVISLSLILETAVPLLLATCYASFKRFILTPYLKPDKMMNVVRIGLRDDESILPDICKQIIDMTDDIVVVIDRPSTQLWNMVCTSNLFKQSLMSNCQCRLVIIPAMWQYDSMDKVILFAKNVWNIHCSGSSSSSTTLPLSPSDDDDTLSCSASSSCSASFVGLVEASK